MSGFKTKILPLVNGYGSPLDHEQWKSESTWPQQWITEAFAERAFFCCFPFKKWFNCRRIKVCVFFLDGLLPSMNFVNHDPYSATSSQRLAKISKLLNHDDIIVKYEIVLWLPVALAVTWKCQKLPVWAMQAFKYLSIVCSLLDQKLQSSVSAVWCLGIILGVVKHPPNLWIVAWNWFSFYHYKQFLPLQIGDALLPHYQCLEINWKVLVSSPRPFQTSRATSSLCKFQPRIFF